MAGRKPGRVEEMDASAERELLMGARKALEAIRARIDGEWDNESLAQYGELHASMIDDVRRIADDALSALD